MFPDTDQIYSFLPKELVFEILRGLGSPDGSASLKTSFNSFCLPVVSLLAQQFTGVLQTRSGN